MNEFVIVNAGGAGLESVLVKLLTTVLFTFFIVALSCVKTMIL